METQRHSEEPAGELPPDAGVVCHACVSVNPPFTNYCEDCGAPLNQFVTFNAFDQSLVEGFAYRRAAEGPPSKIVLAGIWILFGPALLVLPELLLSPRSELGPGGGDFPGDLVGTLFVLGYLSASIALVYRTTANYVRKRRHPAADCTTG